MRISSGQGWLLRRRPPCTTRRSFYLLPFYQSRRKNPSQDAVENVCSGDKFSSCRIKEEREVCKLKSSEENNIGQGETSLYLDAEKLFPEASVCSCCSLVEHGAF